MFSRYSYGINLLWFGLRGEWVVVGGMGEKVFGMAVAATE